MGIKAVSSLLILLLALSSACDQGNELHQRKEHAGDLQSIGFVTVDLNASDNVIRRQEALIGNMIADGFVEFAEFTLIPADIALVNSGSIRFIESENPAAIYPAGDVLRRDINNMLPFGNELIAIGITGLQLRLVMERSVANLPESAAGSFLQISSALMAIVDVSQQAQIVDQDSSPNVILLAGERIVSLQLNGLEVADDDSITIVVNDFLARGGDGYVALIGTEASQQPLGARTVDALEYYLQNFSPLTVQLENRLIIIGP